MANEKYVTADGRYDISMRAAQPLAGEKFLRYDQVGISVVDLTNHTLTMVGQFPTGDPAEAQTNQRVSIFPELADDKPIAGLEVFCAMK